MRPRAVIGLMLGFAAVAASSAEARQARSLNRVPPQAERSRLVIVEGDGGFVIRCESQRRAHDPNFPKGAIPLGSSVRIDRAALQDSNHKDISDGETR